LKYDLYEEAGVREYWIVNPVEENIVVHSLDAASGKFVALSMYAGGDVIKSSAVAGFELPVDTLFEK
jgi:Uma2 family endonuclease